MMTALECPTSEDLKALTLGHLSSEDSDALFHHISECELCRSELETVEDTGDSLISSLRSPDLDAEFGDEPDCQLAVAKALGALAFAGQSRTTAELPALPSSIGEYDIVRPIGRGGMGNVYLARHTKLGREVALKVLATHRLADARMRERFEAEMLAVGRLSHPNIVTAHDAREVNGTAVLVTEFVSGMDLGQLLQRTGMLSVANACEIVRQIAVALSYTHQQGFVHRDIKPSNVMLSASGEVKMLDLGLARLQYGENAGAELTGTGQAMGTADYVAPEQVTDSKSVDVRADIYALGCTLFKLLTGRAPFADEQHTTAFAKMTAHVSKAPPSLSDLQSEMPRGLVSLVESMLAKDPSDRPQTPGQVVEALAPFCKGHDLVKLSQAAAKLEPKPAATAPSSSVTKPTTQSWMRRRVPIAAAIAAGLVGVFLGACLSIIIVITNPDGTKSILELAEGSSVSIQDKVVSENSGLASESAEVIERGKHLLMISVSKVLPQPAPISLHEDGTVSLPLLEPLQVEGLTVDEAKEKIEAEYRKAGIFKAIDSIEASVYLVELGGASQKQGADSTLDESTPLSFGILVNPESTGRAPLIDDIALAAATKLLHASKGEAPVPTEYGTWLELSDDQSAPIRVKNAGKSFALVSNEMTITWPEIQGHVLSTQVSGHRGDASPLEMKLDTELGAKFRQLTRQNLRNQLAIIASGQIRVAPIINSEIGEQVAISGMFEPRELQQLQQWLHGGLVYPLPQAAPKQGDQSDRSTAGSVPTSSETLLQVYQLSETQVDPEVAYRVLSTVLQGKPNVRMELDDQRNQLVVLASPSDHSLVEETLSKLTAHGEPAEGVNEISFNGVWRVLKVADGGRALPVSAFGQQAAAVFHNGQVAIYRNGQVEDVGYFTLRLPKPTLANRIYPQIQIKSSLHEREMVGIYSISAPNQMLICINESGSEVPTQFASMENSPNDLLMKMERAELPSDRDRQTAWLQDPANATVAAAFETLAAWKQGKTIPQQEESEQASKLERAKTNLKRIGLAFHNFHAAYRKLPGTVNTHEGSLYTGNDKKTYPFSWRVAILPFIEQNELFEAYRFDEPWDSENNLKLLDKMPDVYRSPFAGDDQPQGESNILGFAGEHRALGTEGGHSFTDFTDGTSNTLLLFESKATVPWTKPEDIHGVVSQALFFEDQPLRYLLADGSVHSMDTLDLDKLKKMITRDGGEVIAW